MQMRVPSVPLITVDPYFSVWSPADRLTDTDTVHWTGRPQVLNGYAEIDGIQYRFLGADASVPAMEQTGLSVEALSSTYTFRAQGIELTAIFTTPLLPDDLPIMTRPVSYLEIITVPTDGEEHAVLLSVEASEEMCLDRAGSDRVEINQLCTAGGIPLAEMGSVGQHVLEKRGDDVRIGWGYFYIGVRDGEPYRRQYGGKTFAGARVSADDSVLFLFAYDDIVSLSCFGEHLHTVWNRDGKTIAEAIDEAEADYCDLVSRCDALSQSLFCRAVRAGGEKYAELLLLAFRQTIGAHKCVLDRDGEVLFVSKECFSGGFAATVDVSYPSTPLFLLYNPELVLGMLRPVLRFARSPQWGFDFAPHDCGIYPVLDGQVYGGDDPDLQMPIEECGNMILMAAAACVAADDASFARENMDLLEEWARYLAENGEDPANQLCTDDFAGHLSHNCNLALKAVMGIAAMGILYDMLGDPDKSEEYRELAAEMADSWVARAKNPDGSFRLAFDLEDSWSMKYNLVWDRLFGTHLFDATVVNSEILTELRHMNAYGVPLDCRKTYTKSDWMLWTAALCGDRREFERFADAVHAAYNAMPQRVPMSDWFDTVTSEQVLDGRLSDGTRVGFCNRSVQGGLYMKLLDASGKLMYRERE